MPFRVADPSVLVPLAGHSSGVAAVAWAGEELLSLGAGGELLRWSAAGELLQAPRELPGGHALAVRGDGRVLVGTHAGLYQLQDPTAAPERVPGPERGVRGVLWSAGGEGYAVGDEGLLWRAGAAGVQALGAAGPQLQHLAGSDVLLTVDALGAARVFALDGALLGALERPGAGSAAAGPHGLLLAHDGGLTRLDARGAPLEEVQAPPALRLLGVEQGWVSAHRDGLLRRWNPDLSPRGEEPLGHRGFVDALCGPEERLVTGARDRSLRLWPAPAVKAVPSGVVAVGVGLGQLWSTDGFALTRWDGERGLPAEVLPVPDARAVAPGPGGVRYTATLSGELLRWEPGAEAPAARHPNPSPVQALAWAGGLLVRDAEGTWALDPLTLARLGPAEPTSVPASRGAAWTWTAEDGPRWAFFVRGQHLALWQQGALGGADEALVLVRQAAGCTLRSL